MSAKQSEPPNRKEKADSSSLRGTPTWARLLRLCQKELREILRDRRTIVTLVLMPLIVYPILSLAFQRFLISAANSQSGGQKRLVLAVEDELQAQLLIQYLTIGEQALSLESTADRARALGRDRSQWPTVGRRAAPPQIEWVTVDDSDQALLDSQIDLAVKSEIIEPAGEGEIPRAEFRLVHIADSAASREALEFVQQRLRAVNDVYLRQRLQVAGVDYTVPAKVISSAITGPEQSFVSLSALVPLILVLMTITGAVYPAIDLTAGERERGTLEALIAAPVPRFQLLLAKYTAVVTVALLTAAANLAAMTITLYSSGLAKALFGQSTFTFQSLIAVFGLLVLFAAFFSAVLLAITSFARSFKEAQAYLIPLMLISLAPGIISLAPGIEFRGVLAVTPLLNMVLLARDVFQGTVQSGPATAAIISTVLYAASAIAIAAKVFGADAVLYGSQSNWNDWLQRPEQTRPHASLSGALLLLAVIFPVYVILTGFLGQTNGDLQIRMSLAALMTMILFGVFPIAVALITNIRLSDAFALRSTSPIVCLSALLLGASAWPLAHEVFLLHRALGLGTIRPEQIEMARSFIVGYQQLPLAFVLVAMAIVPAVFEELLFRGFLFSALLGKLGAARAIVISAIVFGGFHVVSGSLASERFLPSTFMGLILGWVCWRTASLFPGMILHAIHNGLLLGMGYYTDSLRFSTTFEDEPMHLPAYWISFAVVGLIAGIFVIHRVTAIRDHDEFDSIPTNSV